MTTEEKIEVIRAFDEGKEVEFYDDNEEEWCKKTKNTWDFEYNEYRVKPKPTRLDVANEFWEKTFGIKNEFNEYSCIHRETRLPCRGCTAYKNGECESEKWWNTPCENN